MTRTRNRWRRPRVDRVLRTALAAALRASLSAPASRTTGWVTLHPTLWPTRRVLNRMVALGLAHWNDSFHRWMVAGPTQRWADAFAANLTAAGLPATPSLWRRA